LQGINITTIPVESLKETTAHKKYALQSKLKLNHSRENFWFYTSKRFLHLYDFIKQYDKKDVFHLENDVMLYVNLAEMMPVFTQYYSGIAAVFDNDNRCIPSFVYIPNALSMQTLAEWFLRYANTTKNDMEILALFRKENSIKKIDSLPIIMNSYHENHGLKSTIGHSTENASTYSKNIDVFKSVFDGAAIGQYLGGIDPRNGHSEPGFINESCLFNASLLSYEWILDEHGRKVPYMGLKNEKYRINNLHIHSKRLTPFLSVLPTNTHGEISS
jgi:hypothetical protein